jgi:FAD/FMN-containing dehydrogenase
LPNGDILDNMANLRIDNTGYDLKHLFIGSEGTLGAITQCGILCPTLPKYRKVSLVACKTFGGVQEIIKAAK